MIRPPRLNLGLPVSLPAKTERIPNAVESLPLLTAPAEAFRNEKCPLAAFAVPVNYLGAGSRTTLVSPEGAGLVPPASGEVE